MPLILLGQTILYNYGTISENFVQSPTPQQSVWTTHKTKAAWLLYLEMCAKIYSSVPTSTGDLYYLINNIEKEITSRCFAKKMV